MVRRRIVPNFRFGVAQDVRPQYGAGHYLFEFGYMPANTTTLLASVLGTGVTYGGFAYVDYTSTQADSSLVIYLDDETMGSISFSVLNSRMIDRPEMHSVWKRHYDDTNFLYILGIKPGMTFEKSLKVYYNEEHGTTPFVVVGLIYALI